MARRLTATEAAQRAETTAQVLSSYDGVRLSTSQSLPPKKPTVKTTLAISTFVDVKQRMRLTFRKSGRNRAGGGRVLVDAVVLGLSTTPLGGPKGGELVHLTYLTFKEVSDFWGDAAADVNFALDCLRFRPVGVHAFTAYVFVVADCVYFDVRVVQHLSLIHI